MNRTTLTVVTFIKKTFDQIHFKIKSFTIELVSIAAAQLFPNNTLSSHKVFTGVTELGRPMGGCNFGKI